MPFKYVLPLVQFYPETAEKGFMPVNMFLFYNRNTPSDVVFLLFSGNIAETA